ncbi:MAG: TRAP transporter small permease [Lachnospiraceae bacterium]|nr:TRAP transporter small permease [Lachnospiraceae bacterium]
MNKFSSKVMPVIEQLFGYIGVIMILVETYAVFSRNVTHVATPWVDELLKLLFVWCIFVCGALSFWSDDLISLTLVEDAYKEKKPSVYGILKGIQFVCALIFGGLLTSQLLTIVQTQMNTGETTTVIQYPLWVMNLGVLVGMVLTVIFGVIKLVGCAKYFKKNA